MRESDTITVKALLGLQDEEARTKAWSLVNLLENVAVLEFFGVARTERLRISVTS